MLVGNRKFDIRVWVLVTHSCQVFVFKEGYIRTSATEFTLSKDSIQRPEVHLTNNAIQSQFKNYGKYEDGNILSFQQLQAYLDSSDGMPNFVSEKLMPEINRQIALSMEAVRAQINIGKAFFEIFGYDFIVDADYATWLIEVNTNPSLELSSRLLERLIPRMVNDALKLTVDQVFPPKKPYDQQRLNEQFGLHGYPDTENMWEFLMQLTKQKESSKR